MPLEGLLVLLLVSVSWAELSLLPPSFVPTFWVGVDIIVRAVHDNCFL